MKVEKPSTIISSAYLAIKLLKEKQAIQKPSIKASPVEMTQRAPEAGENIPYPVIGKDGSFKVYYTNPEYFTKQ